MITDPSTVGSNNSTNANAREASHGLRPLTADEILLVAGGSQSSEGGATELPDVEVYPAENPFDEPEWDYEPGQDESGSSSGESPEEPDDLTGNGLDEPAVEAVEAALKGIVATIQEQIVKYGPEVPIRVGDFVAKAGDIADFMGKTIDIIEAGTLLREASQGNLDVAKTASFMASLVGSAALTAAGASPLTVFAVMTAGGLLVEWEVNEISDRIETAYNERFDAVETANPGQTPGELLAVFIMDVLGTTPTNPGGGTDLENDGTGGDGYGDGGYYEYQIP